MAKRTTAFDERIADAIRGSIRGMAACINAHHVNDVFSIGDAFNLTVKDEDKEAVRAGWPFAQRYMSPSNCYVNFHLPEMALLDRVTTPLGGRRLAIHLQFNEDNRFDGFIPPAYAQANEPYQMRADPNVVARLTQVMRNWMQTAADFGLVMSVFNRLNNTFDKDPHHVRYLLPGVLPLLRRTEYTAMAVKLGKVRPNFSYEPLTPELREAINRANELIAEGLFYDTKRRPPVPDINHCRLSVSYSGDVKHQLWDTTVTPLFHLP